MSGKIVIADASTLIVFSKLKIIHVLNDLFGEVIIPEAVYKEVFRKNRQSGLDLGEMVYIKVKKVIDTKMVSLLVESFGRGEAELFVLGKEMKADILIIDEKKARKTARRAGFKVIGVLGLLVMAKRKGVIDVAFRKKLPSWESLV
ncbi:MAG: hypothetical protein SCARUB_02085 [Candidatus Scalindua rubra]|uniref:DUF3368 domain-containing protein n=1 Tax=Candidatus Scalindua rubra TaxID=1872076 RepID=A0A1E3XAV4_9BACT|nr:MAG: hypothetical protein SCARUB_02085 [Candidatus Scalindua rubra]